jgi:predicted O-methyltransferase YrrM
MRRSVSQLILRDRQEGDGRTGDFVRYLSPEARAAFREMRGHPWSAGSTDEFALTLMSALLRESQPVRALQIGTHIGVSAVVLGDVLAHNARPGKLWTLDPDPLALPVAREFVASAGLPGSVVFVEGRSTDPAIDDTLRELGPFDVVYLDASHEYEETLTELGLIFGAWLAGDGVLLLHDAAREAAQFDSTGLGGVRRAMDDWVQRNPSKFHVFVLEPPFWPSVCGLGVMRRA